MTPDHPRSAARIALLRYDPRVVSTRSSRLARGAALAALAVALVFAWRFLPLQQWFSQFQEAVRNAGPWGPALYAAAYALCAVLFIPATVLSLGAGALFGPVLGTGVVLAGASAAAAASFAIARLALRERVRLALSRNRRFLALDRAIAREGARIVLLVRLSPVFPFTWVNYAFGVTGVDARAYVLATIAGMLPGIIAIVYLGHAAGSLTRDLSPIQMAFRVIGALATLAVVVVVGRIARRAMHDAGIDGSNQADPPPGNGHDQRSEAESSNASGPE